MQHFDFVKEFGYCTLSAGEFLFRKYSHTDHCAIMFFAFRPIGCYTETIKTYETQKWKTTKDLKLILLVKSLAPNEWVDSNINLAFSILNPSVNISDFDELTIKQYRFNLREKFVEQLRELGFDGWVTSLEEKHEMELCLFANEIEKSIMYIDKKQYKQNVSTLHRLKVFPTIYILEKIKEFPPLKTFINTDWNKKYVNEKQNNVKLRHLINNQYNCI